MNTTIKITALLLLNSITIGGFSQVKVNQNGNVRIGADNARK